MKTVKDAFNVMKTGLADMYSPAEADAITTLLLTDLTKLSNAQLKAYGDTELNVVQSERLLTQLAQLKTGMPVQYVLGHTEFYGHTFEVNPSVLIPRPETEELVDWIIKTINHSSGLKILDIGTGSGCIPVSLKLIDINNEIFTIDISSKALQTAKHNAAMNNAEITFIETNILNPEPSVITHQKYHVIVSNPPYVTGTDKLQMHRNVTDFEPHTALFVPDADPLLFYNAIADFAIDHLETEGYLFFEINESYGQETVDMLARKDFTNIELRQDMAGKDRMIRAVWV
ncbi:peptide chain release factor N(5)-glutamine methyltransferase [Mucilaginibacter terrae]|uniref:peptide chain release factor N(5)-glutamine methyltransferase n=1 Tax=Mucilaginibacter terrae TaxID=1955052 RepID=A0ABU3GPM2_9SPHI|nr:peptide chain release factor N(5)-glutamine methyltransferase [Mucilaginibacter terrae]MDT3401732.1 release factor glutamine methyltransferase [Mucilaginibacter terrae]